MLSPLSASPPSANSNDSPRAIRRRTARARSRREKIASVLLDVAQRRVHGAAAARFHDGEDHRTLRMRDGLRNAVERSRLQSDRRGLGRKIDPVESETARRRSLRVPGAAGSDPWTPKRRSPLRSSVRCVHGACGTFMTSITEPSPRYARTVMPSLCSVIDPSAASCVARLGQGAFRCIGGSSAHRATGKSAKRDAPSAPGRYVGVPRRARRPIHM